jgi:hypothetical protein
MARYNVRDLFGHFVKPRSRQGKMCPHACCRNRRVHPDNMPVILPNRLLRRASDDDLQEHYADVSRRDDPEAEAARYQLLFEMERRDQVTERREQRQETRRQNVTARKMERESAIEQAFIAAESATNGNMLNRRGLAAGVSDRSLFRGREDRARKYASEELLNHWLEVGRPTEAMFQGADTKVYGAYTARDRVDRRKALRWR